MLFRSSLVALSVIVTLNTSANGKVPFEPIKPLVLAVNYDNSVDIKQYWQSEKLDGIRAIWDGRVLRTRSGHPIQAPEWFIRSLPDFPLEGELWAGRGQFHIVQQTVMDQFPKDIAWTLIKYMLFDIPYSNQNYVARYSALKELTDSIGEQHIQLIEHRPIESQSKLFEQLDKIVELQGEGLMLRNIDSRYEGGRSSDLIKLKKRQDGEARVVGYKLGKGKFVNMMGSLLVELPNGQQFYIGNGFSDQQRKDPPALGSVITYQFNGYTNKGVPRFARFLRTAVEQ